MNLRSIIKACPAILTIIVALIAVLSPSETQAQTFTVVDHQAALVAPGNQITLPSTGSGNDIDVTISGLRATGIFNIPVPFDVGPNLRPGNFLTMGYQFSEPVTARFVFTFASDSSAPESFQFRADGAVVLNATGDGTYIVTGQNIEVEHTAGGSAWISELSVDTDNVDITPPADPTLTPAGNADGTVTATGTAEPGSQVTVTFPSGEVITVAADPTTGAYTATSTENQPSGNVAAQAEDAAGNMSGVTTAAYVDAAAPADPTLTPAGNADGTVTATGTAEPGSQVTVTFPSGEVITVAADPTTGAYTATSTENQPSGNVTAQAEDAAGNMSGVTTAAYVDAAAPADPTLTPAGNADGTVTATGTAEPGSQVTVTSPSGEVITVAADPTTGAYTATSTENQPSGNVAAQAEDAAGNMSGVTTAAYVDAAAPADPTLTPAGNADGTVTATGTAEPGSQVTVTSPSGEVITVAADPTTGAYTATSTENQPSGNVTAQAEDAAGNMSGVTTAAYVDAAAPADPTLTPAGNADGTVTATGTAEPGSQVTVTFPSGEVITVAADPTTGAYTATSTENQPSGNVTAQAEDAAGNMSGVTTAAYVDAAAPADPTLTPAGNADGTVTATGTAEPGSQVTVTFPSGEVITVAADPTTGAYTATSTENQPSGNVTAQAEDAAGNMSGVTTAAYVDAAAPADPTLTPAGNADGTVTATGTAEPGSQVTVTFPSGEVITVAADPTTGAYTATSTENQPSGNVTAQAEDAAGNVSGIVTMAYLGLALSDAERDEIRGIIVEQEVRNLRTQIAANRRAVQDAKERYIAGQRCRTLQDRDNETNLSIDPELEAECRRDEVTRGNTPLTFSSTLQATQDNSNLAGSFFGQTGSFDGERRRLVFGEFDVTRYEGGDVKASFDGRVAWERLVGEDVLLGYFVGADASHTNIDGNFSGTHLSYGLSAGAYFVDELDENLFWDGFVALGYGRNNLDIGNGITDVGSDYETRSIQFGLAFSGIKEYKAFELRPELSIAYGYSDIGDVDLDMTTGPSTLRDGISAGNVSLGTISFTPEFLFPIDAKSQLFDESEFGVAPSLTCDYTKTVTSSSDCGGGLKLEWSASSYDGLREFSARISRDVIGGSTRESLGLEFRSEF